MAHFLTQVANSFGKGYFLSHATRIIHPELLSGLLFLGVFAGSPWLDWSFVESTSDGVIVEFLMIHANIGITGTQYATQNSKSAKKIMLLVSGFYMLFVLAVSLALGNYWLALCFTYLTWNRIEEPTRAEVRPGMISEVFVTFARFAVYMLAAVVGAGIGTYLGADDTFKMLGWGTTYYLAMFLLRNKMKWIRESKIFA